MEKSDLHIYLLSSKEDMLGENNKPTWIGSCTMHLILHVSLWSYWKKKKNP